MAWIVVVGAILVIWLLLSRRSRSEVSGELYELGGRETSGFLGYLGGLPGGHRLLPAVCLVHVAKRGLLLDQGLRGRVRILFEEVVDISIEPARDYRLALAGGGEIPESSFSLMDRFPHFRIGLRDESGAVRVARFWSATAEGDRTADAIIAAWQAHQATQDTGKEAAL